MSKESMFAIECPGCQNRIAFIEYHPCKELAEFVAEQKKAKQTGDQPKRKRGKRGKDLAQGDGDD